jgi:SPX domain protein involved in polyphosphate accumulation
MLSKRYELKFLITGREKERFIEAARPGLEADPHGRDAVYGISSLYFDSPCLQAYWEKLDGVAIRKKFRLRRYAALHGTTPTWGAAFMEIKHRRNNTVYKERVAISDSGLEAILREPTELTRLDQHATQNGTASRATVEAVMRAALRPGFQPASVVSYRREAWLGRVDHRLRVTFDACCRACLPATRYNADIRAGHAILPANLFVMEIKFDHAIPTWIREITVAHHLRLQRFSKYASSIEALNLAAALPSRKIRTVESFEQSLDNEQAETSHPEPGRESSTREVAAKVGG